jgi:hypothetical protein
MAPKPNPKVTESVRPPAPRPSAAERRAAEIGRLSTRQAELKQEAEDRRLARETGTPARPRS